MIGSSNTKPFRKFQVRWKEKLGFQDNPYLIRWTFILFGYSIRIHHWLRSDDNRHFHDHSADLISIVLKGTYYNVVPVDPDKDPSEWIPCELGGEQLNVKLHHVEGIFNSLYSFTHFWKSIWYSKATDRHYLKIPTAGAWTLLLEGKPYHKWGFYVKGKKWRPLRYFHKFGIRQDSNYQ